MREEEISLVPLKPEDADEVSVKVCSMDPWLSMGYRTEAIKFYLLRSDPALNRYGITVSGDLAGVLSLRFPWLFGPFIELMALFDGFRGRGIGGRIIDRLCREYEGRASNLWVTASDTNSGGQRFYGKAGFERAAVLEDLIKPGWDEILLRKRLAGGSSG